MSEVRTRKYFDPEDKPLDDDKLKLDNIKVFVDGFPYPKGETNLIKYVDEKVLPWINQLKTLVNK